MAYTVSSGEGSKTRGQLVSMAAICFNWQNVKEIPLHEIGLATITNRIAFKGEGSNSEMQNTLFGQTEFHPVLTPSFLFLPERLHCCCYIYFHCSYTYNYYNYMEPCALNA
jgi:hypothetical protein